MIIFQTDGDLHCVSIEKTVSRVAKSLHKYCFRKNSLLKAIWRWQGEKEHSKLKK